MSLAVVRRRKKAEAGESTPGPAPAACGVELSAVLRIAPDPASFWRLFFELFFDNDPRRVAAELGLSVADGVTLATGERVPGAGVAAELPERPHVLTHPSFERPPVVNERRPERKAGAVSLAVARRRKKAEAGESTPGPPPAACGVAPPSVRMIALDQESFVRLFFELFFDNDPRRAAAELGLSVADRLALASGERVTGAGAPRELAGCAQVLTHPTFDRPAVANERTPGRKAGAVSLAVVRRRKKAEADKPGPGAGPGAIPRGRT